MTIITESRFEMGDYQFIVTINPSNVAAQMQRDVFYQVGDQEIFLRSFYFDDILPEIIHAFCERFSANATYREQSLKRSTDWAMCNDLFLRNCFNPYFQSNPFLEQIGSLVGAYTFFKQHTPEIIKQADYQRIVQHDSQFEPQSKQFDPKIADIVADLNQLDGVRTLASCQGVSGTVTFENYDVMTLSPHARFAYIWFVNLPEKVKSQLENVYFSHAIYTDDIYPTLQSTGDNAAFLDEIRQWLRQSTT